MAPLAQSIVDAHGGLDRWIQFELLSADLIRRHEHDDDEDIAGSTAGAHFIDGHVDVQGVQLLTLCRIFPRGPDGKAMAEPLVVSIDLSNYVLV